MSTAEASNTGPMTFGGMTPDEAYKSMMQVAWTFDYTVNDQAIGDLYQRAKDNQWDAAKDLDWDQDVDPARPMIQEGASLYYRMPFFKRLSKSQQETFNAHSTAQLLSQFLHGEQGALMTASAVTHAVPDPEAKLYAATQAMDEARHVEVYERYVNKIAIVYPMSATLKKLIDATLKADRYEKIMIGMNMIVEGLALGAFNNMYRQTTCPLLKEITFNVMRDEARHVSFGHSFLGPLIREMNEDDVEDLAEFAFMAVKVILDSQLEGGGQGIIANKLDPGFLKVLEVSEIDEADFFAGLAEAAGMGVTHDLPPGQIHSLKHLMMPAISRVGLITPRVREMYEESGFPLHEDLTVLQRMEDAESNTNILNKEDASY